MKTRAKLIILAVAVCFGGILQAEKPSFQREYLRELHGEELAQARKASDYAERLRGAFEGRYASYPHEIQESSLMEAEAEAEKVVAAFRAVLDQYPGTEIAAYAAVRLAGFYKYCGDYDGAIAIVKETAEQHAGSPMENKQFFTLGLMYLQSKHDPEEAVNWFKLIPKPSSDEERIKLQSYNEDEKRYLSAQQQIAKCELKRGKVAYAKRRYERLMERYPEYKDNLQREFGFVQNECKAAGTVTSDEDNVDIEAIDNELYQEERDALGKAEKRRMEYQVRLKEALPAIDLINEIKSSDSYQLSERCKTIIKDLQKQGVDCEKTLFEVYKEDGFVRERAVVINALQELGTEKAKETLIEIAINPGTTAHNLGPRAVKALSALTDDSTTISRCLESDVPETRDTAALQLAGKELSSTAVFRLSELLKADSWVTHNLVMTAFKTDISKQMTREKVDLIINAIPKIESVITLNKDGQLAEMPWNSREMVTLHYLSALSEIEGGKSYLEGRLAESDDVTRQLIVLGLANRGERQMRDEVRAIIDETDSGFIRTMAVHSLREVGDSDDIELLERLKENDPFVRTYVAHGEPSEKDHYPVRSAAKDAIASIKNRIGPSEQ